MEKIQLSKGHSQAGECRWMDKSGHGKNPTEQGALTNWRAQTDRQFRTQEESNQARGTHRLESADEWTSQDTERTQLSEGHSQTGEHRQTDNSGHKKNLTKQRALTYWREQPDRQVRTQKESD